MKRRKRYAQVGTGSRGWCYTRAIVQTHRADCELVGLCDRNPGRLDLYNRRIAADLQGQPVPVYPAARFDAMIREQTPDVVVVTTTDCFHDEYIVRAMDLGCDVITEKPMTTDARKCQRIVDAVARTGRDLRVTFNCRYMPHMVQVKDLLMRGVVGQILSAEVQWWLDIHHGASYFRRWHGELAKSGGLLIHKATHHLDLVNWFLSASPVEVSAMGARRFYGAGSPLIARYGLRGHGERCLTCRRARACPFYLDLRSSPEARALYLDCERHDGYWRDRCVFHPRIDIMDSMNLVVRYDNGALLSYALNAFLPYEGFRYAFNGTKGRLEFESLGTPRGRRHKPQPTDNLPGGRGLRVYPNFGKPYAVALPTVSGGHGGGDDRLMSDLLGRRRPRDRFLRAADFASGAMGILIGAAANRSMRTHQPVRIADLVRGLPRPRLPTMKPW